MVGRIVAAAGQVGRLVAGQVGDEREEDQFDHLDHHPWKNLAKQYLLWSVEKVEFAEAVVEQIVVAAVEQIVEVVGQIAVVAVEQTVEAVGQIVGVVEQTAVVEQTVVAVVEQIAVVVLGQIAELAVAAGEQIAVGFEQTAGSG